MQGVRCRHGWRITTSLLPVLGAEPGIIALRPLGARQDEVERRPRPPIPEGDARRRERDPVGVAPIAFEPAGHRHDPVFRERLHLAGLADAGPAGVVPDREPL
jgi:hypothetical protein